MKRHNQREADTVALRADLAAIGAELVAIEPVVKVRGTNRTAIVGVLERHGIIAFDPPGST